MKLDKRKVEMFQNYVEKSLVEKFGYTTEVAKTQMGNYNLEKALTQNSAAILYFDAEYWAGQVKLNNGKFNN
ncbi:hypothetical protein [Clostridium sp. DL1XJH146]